MDKVIIGIAKNPVQAGHTHQAGWTAKWVELLDAEVLTTWTYHGLKGKQVFIYNDINDRPGIYNLPGFKKGSTKHVEIVNRLMSLSQFLEDGGDATMLDYFQTPHAAMAKRDIMAGNQDLLDNLPVISQVGMEPHQVVIGDSHSVSISPKGFATLRMDGRTLKGALKKGLASYMTGEESIVAFSFGEIDMRYHIGQQSDPYGHMDSLISDYRDQIQEIRQSGVDVYVRGLMAPTKDSRKIPNSGKLRLRDTRELVSYVGDGETRQDWTRYWNTLLDSEIGNVISMEGYEDEDGFLDETKMESGGSVHLRKDAYNLGWINEI